jgi:hypothetical protein
VVGTACFTAVGNSRIAAAGILVRRHIHPGDTTQNCPAQDQSPYNHPVGLRFAFHRPS